QGHLDEAEANFREARRIFHGAGYRTGTAILTSNLARVEARRGNWEAAEEAFLGALAELEAVGADTYVFETSYFRAENFVFAGKHELAQPLLERLLRDLSDSAPPGVRAGLLRLLGYTLLRAGDPERARANLEESLAAARQAGAKFEIARSQRALHVWDMDQESSLHDPDSVDEYRRLFHELGVVERPAIDASPQAVGAPPAAGRG
ncbi:MAG: tetratricopeptide repeat protein, partial [Acidimicrobiia bacterium]|nr:tetratricopeptide repeat protein [Acidimicrobiia bacterium]